MTVVLAARTATGVTVVADTLTTDGHLKMHAVGSKLWQDGPYTFGAAGTKRGAQVVRYFTDWPTYRPGEDDDIERFLVTKVVPAVIEACERGGVTRDLDGLRCTDVTLLVVLDDTIAEVDEHGCVYIDSNERWAIGSGAHVALGALGDTGPWTNEQVIEAGRRSIGLSLGCGGELDLLTVITTSEAPGEPNTTTGAT